MSPEEYLAFIEGVSSLTDAVTHIRQQLVEKGWTEGGAEGAAITVFSLGMQQNMIQQQQPKGRGR